MLVYDHVCLLFFICNIKSLYIKIMSFSAIQMLLFDCSIRNMYVRFTVFACIVIIICMLFYNLPVQLFMTVLLGCILVMILCVLLLCVCFLVTFMAVLLGYIVTKLICTHFTVGYVAHLKTMFASSLLPCQMSTTFHWPVTPQWIH